MSDKKELPIVPDPRTDEEWKSILEACKSDPNYIHPKESQALAKLKEQYPDVALHPFWNKYPKDKALYAFLFARKLDVARTADVLKEHLSWRKTHGFMEEVRISQVNQKMLDSAYAFHVPGKRDFQGRGVCYIFMNRFKPKEYQKGSMARMQIWYFEHHLRTEPLDCFRFGFTYIEDISGVGMSNMQSDKAEQKQTTEMLEIFPLRIRSILVVEPGVIIRALLKIAKFFVKKKILQRVECVKRGDLLERMSPESLLTDFGGAVKFDFREYIDDIRRKDGFEYDRKKHELVPTSTTSSTAKPSETENQQEIDADAQQSAADDDADVSADGIEAVEEEQST